MSKPLKDWYVALDVFLVDHHNVMATSKKEAIEKAMEKSEYNDGGAEFTVHEAYEEPLEGEK